MQDPLYAAAFGCILTLGLPLNAVALWILLRHHNFKSPSAVFMVNLAISDLLLVITLPMRVYFYATGIWQLGNMMCLLSTMLFRTNIRTSSFFITFISVDRLLAVVYPLRSRHLRTSSNAVKGAVLVWLYVVVMSIPESLNYSNHLRNQNQTCFEPTGNRSRYSVIFYLANTSIFIMLAVNIVCTAMVSWTLYNHISHSAMVKNKMNVMVLFVMNLIMFTVCFLPLSVGVFVNNFKLRLVICLASMNCCLDPLLYYFSLDAFWKKSEEVETTRGQKSNDSQL